VYHSQSVVKMWVFSKNTIAGDLGVTPIIQCLASMLITSTLVHSDLHASTIKPLPFVYPHVAHLPDPRLLLSKSYRQEQQRKSIDEKDVAQTESETKGIKYYYWMLVRFIFEGTERNMLLAKPGFANWWGRFIWTAAQGALIGIIFGFPIWCLAIVILGPIYGDGNLGNKWAPQVIKLVYGAIVGWVTNPVIAILALGSQADHHLIVVEEKDEEGRIDGEGTPTQDDSPGLTPLVPSTPIIRPRAISNLSSTSRSSRPPMTTNVSRLSPLPPNANLPAESPTALSRPMYRDRGLTVSSIGSNYSYALGGSGGRAQRTRSASTLRAPVPAMVESGHGSGVPEVMVSRPSQDLDTTLQQAEGGDSLGVFGGVTVPVPSSPSRPSGRARSASTLAALGEVVEPHRE
jgi:hypothetical protein